MRSLTQRTNVDFLVEVEEAIRKEYENPNADKLKPRASTAAEDAAHKYDSNQVKRRMFAATSSNVM